MKKIQVGFLVSYDYDLLKNSIPRIYDYADTIYLAIDKDRLTWNGNSYTIDPSFFSWLKTFDTDGKIHLYEDCFYLKELTTIQNDTRERTMLSEKMGVGNWLIQLDADEYFLDFKRFVDFLRTKDHYLDNPEKNKIAIGAFHLNLYKRVEGGFLYVNKPSKFWLATNYPNYKLARITKERIIYSKGIILHETISRTEKDLIFKLENWGHNTDIDKHVFLEKWRTITKDNYKSSRDFFYLEADLWKKLDFIEGETMEDVISNLSQKKNLIPKTLYVWGKNFGQWFKHLPFNKRLKLIK